MKLNIRCWLLAVCLLLTIGPLFAAEPIKIGILAYRPKVQVLAQWSPLAAALDKAIPGYSFVVEAYDYKEMQAAVEARNVDFVLTNPGAYVLMQHRSGLSAPLATLHNLERGKPVAAFGGVIFTLATRSDISQLADLRGKTVAATATGSLGGYQMQAYELVQNGFRLPWDIKLMETEMPHDRVVDAVLNGQADVGFVRSGVLESLADEKKLKLANFKIINRQNIDFPLQLSTRLYPEWPFVALPHTDKGLKRKVAAFLLSLDANASLIKSLRIHGFDVPASYEPVEDLLRELRLPPYDLAPAFTLADVWGRYRWAIMAGLLGSGLLVLLAFRLMLSNRQLKTEKANVQKLAAELEKNGSLIQAIIEGTSDAIMAKDVNSRYTLVNKAAANFAGKSASEIIGKDDTFLFSPAEANNMFAEDRQVMAAGRTMTFEEQVTLATGEKATFISTKGPLFDGQGNVVGLFSVSRNVTEKKKVEEAVWHQANFDALTCLPNRRLVTDRLEQAIKVSHREGSPLALLYIDLDQFKEVNDSLGHEIGDALLKEAAQRMQACVRESDTVGRLSGDEFVLILSKLEDVRGAERIANDLLLKLTEPFWLGGGRVNISGSIGITLYPDHASDVASLLKNADRAMYQAKRQGRNRFHFYTA